MKKYCLLLFLLVTTPSFADTFVARYDLADSMDQFESSRTFSFMRSGFGYTHMLRSDTGLECRITIALKDSYSLLPEAEGLVFIFNKESFYLNNYNSEFYGYKGYRSTMRLGIGANASQKLIDVYVGSSEFAASYNYHDSPHTTSCWSQNEFDYEDVRMLLSDFFVVKRQWPSLREIVETAVEYVSDIKQ